MRSARALAALVPLLACGCARGEPAEESYASDPYRADSFPAAPAPAAPAYAQEGWTLTARGIGPLRVGTSVARLMPELSPAPDTADIGGGCELVRAREAPDSVLLMIEGRRLVRVDVIGGRTTTAEGVGVGDTEARIRQLYPGVRRVPHRYTSGAYLVAIPGAPADTMHRLVFETDGTRVTRFRGGTMPQVEWVEGCA